MMAISIIDAASLLFLESKFCHITPLLRTLHWLPFKYCIVLKVLLITFKAIHGPAPSYISNLISVKDINGRYSLRSNNGILLNAPTCESLATLGVDLFVWSSLNYRTIFHFLLEIYLL